MRLASALIALWLLAVAAPLQAQHGDDDSLWQQPASASDDPLLRGIATQLAQPQQLARRFVQQKQLKILQRPLRTEGVMLYRAGRGVCWHTEQPIVNTLVLEPHQLRQLGDDDNADALVIGAGEQPALFGFTQLFFSLLAGQMEAAAEQFEFHVAGDTQAWQIGLLPRSALLRRFIARMQLDGGAQIDRVTVVDPGGDRTLIEFSAASNAAAGLLPAVELLQRCFGDDGADGQPQ